MFNLKCYSFGTGNGEYYTKIADNMTGIPLIDRCRNLIGFITDIVNSDIKKGKLAFKANILEKIIPKIVRVEPDPFELI